MNAPEKGLNPTDFEGVIASHVEENYIEDGEDMVCRKCRSIIQQTTMHVSIHSVEFGDSCSGFGECKPYPLPYCPECEGEPQRTSTCIHVSMLSS